VSALLSVTPLSALPSSLNLSAAVGNVKTNAEISGTHFVAWSVMAAGSKRLFVYIFVAIILFVRDVASQNCIITTCAELTSCTSCIIGADPKTKPLQLMQKPDFIFPVGLQRLNTYTLEYPCNISCKWNTLRQTCSDLPLTAATDDPNFIYPFMPGHAEYLGRFDLYIRMEATVFCESSTGN
jgi:hypothetical protein